MSVLDQSLRAGIQSGVLPTSIAGARFGRGRGGRCAVCHLAIRLPDTEVEVEVEVETEVDGAFQNHASLKVDGEVDDG